MPDTEHLARVRKRKAIWNGWRSREPDIAVNLRGANLARSDLYERNLTQADLRKADLFGADLRKADLRGADLRGAILRHAQLRFARLSDADLSDADLYHANFYKATLPKARLRRANLVSADLTETDLERADLANAKLALCRLVKTSFAGANLSGCVVYGVSAWDVELVGANQTNLVISPLEQPTITVDDLEMAQFIYLLLNNEKIRNAIDTVAAKAVLILGRFTTERKNVLEALRRELRKVDLLSIIFDFDKPASRDTHETITTLARLSRFVVADITEPKSIPQELVSIVESLPSVPVQPILLKGETPWGMYDHIKRYPWVEELIEYEDLEQLIELVPARILRPTQSRIRGSK